MTITESKENTINFTDPISIETYVFLVSRPKELSRALLFVLPFTSDVSMLNLQQVLFCSYQTPELIISHYDIFPIILSNIRPLTKRKTQYLFTKK